MPAKTRPVGVKSTPVRVSLDELSTELLRRCSEEVLVDMLLSASLAADRRLRNNHRSRHDQYHAKLFFRRIAARLPNPTDDLAIAVGLKDAAQLKVEAATDDTIGMEVQEPALEEVTEELDPIDEFAGLLDIPTFEDYASVFDKYPYVRIFMDEKRNERLLALGYASGRDSEDDLIIRNCVLVGPDEKPGAKGTAFNDIVSVVGILRKTKKGVRQFIKVVPYRVGSKVRFWHHVRGGGGDKPEWNRHLVLTDKGLKTLHTRQDWNNYQG